MPTNEIGIGRKSEGAITDATGKKPDTIRQIPLKDRGNFAKIMLELMGESSPETPNDDRKTEKP